LVDTVAVVTGPLHIVDSDLAACVSCGLCLPHCPTWRVTGDEALSPRGRITLMREVQWNNAPIDDRFIESMDTCVQCRGCETACPSGVPYGRLIEGTKPAVAHRTVRWWHRLGYAQLGHHRRVLMGSSLLAMAQRAHLVPKRIVLPRLAIRRTRLHSSGNDAWMYVGCVMDAWQRDVHAATVRVMEATGAGVQIAPGGCCGALHVHAGLTQQAHAQMRATMASMPGDAPIVVNSAGCGAALKDAGHLLDTDEARAFSARVVDVHEWLAERLDRIEGLSELSAEGSNQARAVRVAVQDPCHLRHVQRTHLAVRQVLSPFVTVVELDDEGLCCGAGGAFSTFHPELAGDIRDRKMGAIDRSDTAVVASANPGCAMHLHAGGAVVMHPMEIIDRALRGVSITGAN
jgi:glycolate oxidase iron-sulfur subunit